MKRGSSKSNIHKDCVCPECRSKFDYTFGVRPRFWAYGYPGVQFVSCSPQCALKMEKQHAS